MRRSSSPLSLSMTRCMVLCMVGGLVLEAQEAPESLRIKVLEGEGAVYGTGSRATRGITVEVTDQTGRTVEAAAVNFVLPTSGASGVFASGGRTETQTTGRDGHAAAWGMRWGTTPGPVEVRISAQKGAARASTICTVGLNYSTAIRPGSGGHKWLWIALATAGAAGGGAAALGLGGKPGTATAVVPTNPARVGAPTISLEKP